MLEIFKSALLADISFQRTIRKEQDREDRKDLARSKSTGSRGYWLDGFGGRVVEGVSCSCRSLEFAFEKRG